MHYRLCWNILSLIYFTCTFLYFCISGIMYSTVMNAKLKCFLTIPWQSCCISLNLFFPGCLFHSFSPWPNLLIYSQFHRDRRGNQVSSSSFLPHTSVSSSVTMYSASLPYSSQYLYVYTESFPPCLFKDHIQAILPSPAFLSHYYNQPKTDKQKL